MFALNSCILAHLRLMKLNTSWKISGCPGGGGGGGGGQLLISNPGLGLKQFTEPQFHVIQLYPPGWSWIILETIQANLQIATLFQTCVLI